MKKKYFYLIHLEFLGFRFSGWQKQTNSKTIQEMVDKTLSCVLSSNEFKTLGASRTDAMVSAKHFIFELFSNEKIDLETFIEEFDANLPADIKALKIDEVDSEYQIIGAPKLKEYMYYFSFGTEKYPFSAPFMVNIGDNLDIELMKKGAKLFEGAHNFRSYCYRPNPMTKFDRVIDFCEITDNTILKANFFPPKSYILHVYGKGFMRQQVRLMAGTLFRLGMGEIDLEIIKKSLEPDYKERLGFVAPSSGLFLNQNRL